MSSEPISAEHFRNVLGQYPTGVCLITTIDEAGQPVGMVVGSFASVSLEPPLVSFMPAHTSSSWPVIRASGRFAVNVLSAEQEKVVRAFTGRERTRFDGLGWTVSPTGMPQLHGSVAYLECDIAEVFVAGDHDIVIGAVTTMTLLSAELPMIFYRGGFGEFTPRSLVAGVEMIQSFIAPVDRCRPALEALTDELGCGGILSGLYGEEFIIFASAGSETVPWIPETIGQRYPAKAPLGRSLFTFAPEAEFGRWAAGLTEQEQRYLDVSLRAVRERGYSISADSTEFTPALRSGPNVAPLDPGYELPDPTLGGHVHSVAAPIFDADGCPFLVMSLYGLDLPANSAQQVHVGERLLATTRQLSQHLSDTVRPCAE